jgi:ABC-type phosphate transport system substrate-binding protein
MAAGVIISMVALLATGFGLSLFKKKSSSSPINMLNTQNTSPLTTNLGGVGSTTPVHIISTPTQRKRKTRKLNKSRK